MVLLIQGGIIMLSPKLETERLILRRWQASDIDVLYEMITDKRLSKFLKMPNITKEDELKRQYICKRLGLDLKDFRNGLLKLMIH